MSAPGLILRVIYFLGQIDFLDRIVTGEGPTARRSRAGTLTISSVGRVLEGKAGETQRSRAPAPQ